VVAIEVGMNAYLTKPFSPEEFQEVVKEAGARTDG
jgi:CheY-like chemotaxis protein